MVRLSNGYEERAKAVLAPLVHPGYAGSQVSTSQDPLSEEGSVWLAKLGQRRIASMSEYDGCCSQRARHAGAAHKPFRQCKSGRR